MPLTLGTRLGDYEILALIGAGGMGEVYRARDTKLGREVAIKVLPEAFSRDEDRLARFEREARLLASLNHPGIATLHGFEKHDGVRFLVMELVEGETLEARIERGAIPIDEALPLFAQMAEAMEAAHNKGVVHRDLKPANIKITPEGRPKILDFGLAKGYATPESNVSESPTRLRQGSGEASPATSAGIILGTAPYMSPEQVRGKSLDKRTDIWSFGCVLFEALTACKAFDGDTVADILGAIVKTEPDWESIPDVTPRKVRELLGRCLKKDVRRRLRDMGEAWVALDEASAEEPTEVAVERRPKTLAVMTLVAVMATGLALVNLFRLTRSSAPPSRPVTITEISLPPGTELRRGGSSAVAISPDGQHVAYCVKRGETRELYLRALDQMEAKTVDKGEGAGMPFFSPDGEWLGFWSNPERKLMKVSVSGGAAVTITEMPGSGGPRGASWGPDGNIVVNPFNNVGLSRVSANGGELEVLTPSATSPDSESPTIGKEGTREGVILGTAGYMSPEQARGQPVDKRPDVWAFGSVSYEMLTGKPAFPGEGFTDIIASIVHSEPDWNALPISTPTKVRDLLRRCLQKDLHRRMRDVGDARIELEEASSEPAELQTAALSEQARRRSARALVLTVALTAIVTALTVWGLLRHDTTAPGAVTRAVIPFSTDEALAIRVTSAVAISPDGRHVAYAVRRREIDELYMRVGARITTKSLS